MKLFADQLYKTAIYQFFGVLCEINVWDYNLAHLIKDLKVVGSM